MSKKSATNQIMDQVSPKRIVMVVMTLVSVGAVFYHYVEDLRWLDSIYFSVITLTTVGYGDITPRTDLGKIFTIFYVLIGVGIIATSLSYLIRQGAVSRMDRKKSGE